jgi:hypothetical protein
VLRILALDHFFSHDLDALEAALAPGETMHRIPYQRLRRRARRMFPADAFSGVVAAFRPDLGPVWIAYRRWIRRVATWLLSAYQPTVFVVPSDAIFYVRPLIEIFAQDGLFTAVVQKETTISPMVMERHSRDVAEHVPFMSSVMTVCSERHRDFWIMAGAEPHRVIVTGQPRFDIYAHPKEPPLDQKLLYLSYDDVAYLPSDRGEVFSADWRDLRRETEEALAGASQSWTIIEKRHPQQSVSQNWLGPEVTRASQSADTRRLILEATAVVGFQTTALFEAIVANRPVLYPAWGSTFDQCREMLIPFDRHPEATSWLRDGLALRNALADPDRLTRPGAAARAFAEDHLGRVDGGASARTVEVLRRIVPLGVIDERPSVWDHVQASAKGLAARPLAHAPRLVSMFDARVAGAVARRASEWRQLGNESRAPRRPS